MSGSRSNPGLAESLSALVAEIREDRASTNRQITELTGAIREQGAKIGLLSESITTQWQHIDKQRDGLQQADSKVEAIARSQVWTRETREAIMQGIGLLVVVAGFLSGPLITFVGYRDHQTSSDLVQRMAAMESRLAGDVDRLQQKAAADEVDQRWRDRAFRVQSQLSGTGVVVDWGNL